MALNESTIPDLLNGPVNIKWEAGVPVPVASAGLTAVLYNRAVYVGGGTRPGYYNCKKISIYHPDTKKWDDNALITPHLYFAMTVLVDKLIIIGGRVKGGYREVTNKLLTLQGGQWEDYSQMPTARCWASAVSHQSMMIVMGGRDDKHMLSTTELLYSTTGQWVKCNDLPQPLQWLRSVIVDDMLYTLGGITDNDDDDDDDYFSKAVYAAPLHALSNHQLEWQQLADTPWAASSSVIVNNKYLLAVGRDGAVYVLKGEKAGSMITSTSWESIGTLPIVQRSTSTVCLGNQIIVIGGFDAKNRYHNTYSVTIGTFQ